jgi:23S rRNA (pseudouridine1915-N3)-methyltransferase
MQIHLIAIGKNKDKTLQGLIDEYLKRLSWDVKIVEIAAPQCSDLERKMREAELIRAALPPKATVILLDERGENVNSLQFADKIAHYQQHAQTSLAFVIGGADGLDATLQRGASWMVSFGKLTWPHMMVRLMLAEQLYRASTILSGHPYHRV